MHMFLSHTAFKLEGTATPADTWEEHRHLRSQIRPKVFKAEGSRALIVAVSRLENNMKRHWGLKV
jgi:hypothetical protein